MYYLLLLVYTCKYYIYLVYVYKKYLFLLLCCHTKRIWGIQLGFGYSWVSVSGMDFEPNRSSSRVRILSSGFNFGCPDIPPDSNPTRCHPYCCAMRQQQTRVATQSPTCLSFYIILLKTFLS